MKTTVVTALEQVFGFAIAGVTVGALIQAGIGAGATVPVERTRGFFRRTAAWLKPYAGGLAITIAVVAAFSFWPQTWSFWVTRSTERGSWSHLSVQEAGYADAKLTKANMPYLEFVRSRLKPGDTYSIAPKKQLEDVNIKQWTSYVLIPNLLTDEADADALLIFGPSPKSVDYDRERFPVLEEFAPGYALALRMKSGTS